MFTLLGQSIGSLVLGIEAFLKYIPDIYFETTGYAFTYPLFYYLGNVPVCCYTHYPTISSDMLQRVQDQSHSYNNRQLISRSPLLTRVKLVYYKLFARLYSLCGRCSSCVMVNSSWTQAHINYIWSLTYKTRIVYPPCDVKKFDTVFESSKHDENFYIASVAQIRPEKNHQLQIKALAKLIQKYFNFIFNINI
jgi:alpha-1,2-mannosyltransferase